MWASKLPVMTTIIVSWYGDNIILGLVASACLINTARRAEDTVYDQGVLRRTETIEGEAKMGNLNRIWTIWTISKIWKIWTMTLMAMANRGSRVSWKPNGHRCPWPRAGRNQTNTDSRGQWRHDGRANWQAEKAAAAEVEPHCAREWAGRYDG